MKRYVFPYYWILALLTVLPFGCSVEEEGVKPDALPGEGLSLHLQTSIIKTRATQAGEDALNENKISHAQLLVFNADGNRTRDGYRTFTFTGTDATGVIASGNWKENGELFDQGPNATYDIYVVANAHGGNKSLEGIGTLLELQNAVDEDTDIWKFEMANIGGGQYTGKLFTMSGVNMGFIPSACEENHTIEVVLQRVAVRVEVNLSFTDDFKAKFTPTGFYGSLRNYATKGLLLADREGSFSDRGLAGNGTDDPQAVSRTHDYEARTAQLLLYTYPTNWGNDVILETFVLLNMPGVYNGGEGDPDNGTKMSNYYKIPVRLGGADAHVLNRNTIYRVNVKIDRLGQPELDTPVELKPAYEVMPWEPVTIDVDESSVNYLELLKSEIVMKNIASSNEEYFTSSSKIATTKVAEVYYFDKYGERQTIPESQYGSYHITVNSGDGLSGKITVNSDVPTNNGIRYIKVEVTNEQGASKTFTVKQYPLEYIVTVPGWYSYRDDFKSTYEKLDGNNRKMWNDLFASKVYTQGAIYEYAWYNYNSWLGWRTGSSPSTVQLGAKQSSNPNNNMYFVRITKTSDQYVLSDPAMDEYGYTESSTENNKLVAPAFMIASQLGTVLPTNFNTAKEHCKQYAEKSLDGQVYDDWRLATEAELAIIDKYQNTDGSVIDEVLGGRYYWAASGVAYRTQNGSDGERDNAYIRCVRTVKPDEPIVNDKQ